MKATLLVLISILLVGSCQQVERSSAVPEKKAKIKVAIMYPTTAGEKFDMEYYANSHMPMVAELFGDSLINYSIDQGLSGRTSDDTAAYVAIGCFYFERLSSYQNSFGPNAEKILSDIPNYTSIQPIVQISEIVK